MAILYAIRCLMPSLIFMICIRQRKMGLDPVLDPVFVCLILNKSVLVLTNL